MWKRIIYYSIMIFLGVLFMLMVSYGLFSSKQTSLEKHSLKTGDYTNILELHKTFSNKNELAISSTGELEFHVFETAKAQTTPYVKGTVETTKELLDIDYTIVVVDDNRVLKNDQKDGVIYNYSGLLIENSVGESFNYYDNNTVDGVVGSENTYKGYDLSSVLLSGAELYSIPYNFLVNYSGFTTYDIKKISFIQSDGTSVQDILFDTALDYSGETHLKVNELIPYYNDAVLNSNKKSEYKAFYSTWKKEFKAIDGALIENSIDPILNAKYGFKVFGTLVLYLLFVFVLGDLLVGKRRIVSFFSSVRGKNSGSFTNPNKTNNDASATNIVDAEAENVKEVSNEKN